jgi:hypothetical protein
VSSVRANVLTSQRERDGVDLFLCDEEAKVVRVWSPVKRDDNVFHILGNVVLGADRVSDGLIVARP